MRTEKQTIITLDKHEDNLVVRLKAGHLRVVGADGNEIVVSRETGGSCTLDGRGETYDRLVVEGGTSTAELWIGNQARGTVRVFSGPASGYPANYAGVPAKQVPGNTELSSNLK